MRRSNLRFRILGFEITSVRLDVEQVQLVSGGCETKPFVVLLKDKRDGCFLEEGRRKDLQNCVRGMMQLESFFGDDDEDIHGDGDPDLGLHGIGRSTEEALDAKVLLDPFEEEFDLPTLSIDGRYSEGWQ